MLDDPADYPPGGAEIRMSIDGRERRWPVQLPEGISAASEGFKTATGCASRRLLKGEPT
jgi:hypothetical protein